MSLTDADWMFAAPAQVWDDDWLHGKRLVPPETGRRSQRQHHHQGGSDIYNYKGIDFGFVGLSVNPYLTHSVDNVGFASFWTNPLFSACLQIFEVCSMH